MTTTTLAQLLSDVRISLQSLAERAGVPYAVVASYAIGRRSPSNPIALYSLADACDAEAARLVEIGQELRTHAARLADEL